MSVQDQLKRGTDQSSNAARDTMRKGEAKAQQTMEAAQIGFQIAGDGAREMNLKLIEMMRESTEAFFSFAEEVASARDPGNLTNVWTRHMQSRMELLSKQGMELVALGQRIASNSFTTMSDSTR
jgi:hypothetical protein